jgi:hypothetical protein
VSGEGAHGADLVLAHEAAVALAVGREDGGETAFDAQCPDPALIICRLTLLRSGASVTGE